MLYKYNYKIIEISLGISFKVKYMGSVQGNAERQPSGCCFKYSQSSQGIGCFI